MAILSQHLVLRDAPVDANPISQTNQGPFTLSVALPPGFEDTATGTQPVLSFFINTTGGTTGIRFTASTDNGGGAQVAFTGDYTSDLAVTVQEVLNAGDFVVGGTNSVIFDYVSGDGTVDISDVVLLLRATETNTGVGA